MPETPIWLLSRNRQAEALESLQWLRGWVDSTTVQAELEELQRSRISAQMCYKCEKQQEICHHPLPKIGDKVRDLFRRRTLRPFSLIATLFILSVFAGITPFRPYIVQILYYYQSPIDPNDAVSYMGYFGFAANVLLVCIIRSLGKRIIYLWSLAIVVLSLLALGIFSNEILSDWILTCIIFRHLWFRLSFIGSNIVRDKYKRDKFPKQFDFADTVFSDFWIRCIAIFQQFRGNITSQYDD